MPAWLDGLAGRRALDARRARHPRAAPGRHRRLRVRHPRGRNRVADRTTGSIRSRRWTPTSTGSASCSTARVEPARARRRPIEGFLFFSSSEIYGDPTPEHIPTPETYRGNVSCTGPRACYDESKRYGETLCVNFARQHGAAGHDRPAVQQLRARPEDHRPARHSRPRPRHPRRAETSSCSPTARATRTFCYVADAVVGYYKVLVRGRRRRGRTTSASRSRRSRCADLAERLVDARHGRSRVRRPGRPRDERRSRVPRRQPGAALSRHRRRRASELGYEPTVGLDEGLRRSLLWYAENRDGGGGLMRVSRSSAPATSASSRASCLAEQGHEVTCVDVDAANGRARSPPGDAPIYEAGLDELLAAQRRRQASRDDRPRRRPSRRADLTLIAVGTPFDGDGSIDLGAVVRQPRARSARRSGASDDYHVVVVKSTVVPGTTDDVVAAAPRGGVGRERRVSTSASASNPEFLTEGQAVAGLHGARPDRARRATTSATAGGARGALRGLSASVPRRPHDTRRRRR